MNLVFYRRLSFDLSNKYDYQQHTVLFLFSRYTIIDRKNKV